MVAPLQQSGAQMDGNGARELHKRLQAQEHWRQAEAVQRGEQPAADPDAHELEELGDGVRRYGRETQRTTVDGAPALVTHRFCKRLVGGRWETSLEVEQVRSLVSPSAEGS